MLNALINHYHHGAKETLLKSLPKEEAQHLLEYSVTSHDITPAITNPRDLIRKIHYSWLAGPLKKIPESFRALVLAALPRSQAEKLSKLLEIPSEALQLSDLAAQFVLDHFYYDYLATEEIPPQLLPHTKLNFLTNFNKMQLIELIDYLGLYDLSHEIKRIVDKNQLRRIFLCLPSSMQSFVKICLVQRDWLTPSPLSLDKWKGQCDVLVRSLHRRGLVRLGLALSGRPEALVKYISHVLDTGRGAILLKNYSKEPVPNVGPALETQVINVVKFINENR